MNIEPVRKGTDIKCDGTDCKGEVAVCADDVAYFCYDCAEDWLRRTFVSNLVVLRFWKEQDKK